MTDDAPTDSTTGLPVGLPEIDDVLTRLAAIEDLPVAEHVGVYEHAHQQLRQALDAG